MTIPPEYAWLNDQFNPKVIREALKLYGTKEKEGDGDNPVILEWARDLGLRQYVHDEIAWCGLFAATVVKRAGYAPPQSPLWALNWLKWGDRSDVPMLGDVLVFKRTAGGHVGFCVGEDDDAYHVLGGNQSDRVKVSRLDRSRLIGSRRSPWKVGQPATVRVVKLAPNGALSVNEA